MVAGYCPMGCGLTLFLGAEGFITCGHIECPRPDAVAELLVDRETEHLVTFTETEFTVKHPLRERLDDALLSCVLHKHLRAMDGPPVWPGTYRARRSAKGWGWSKP